ncbi:hypothetical protein CRUP_035888 [Coryphaenoides rupestris]|nr:hypothetical protein CRUP_035888 [Coryphaenoides rupestris]
MSDQGKGSASTSASAPAPGSDTYKGWLFKWTNYLKGYQRRWFVLSNGLLSYYSRNVGGGSAPNHTRQPSACERRCVAQLLAHLVSTG